MCYVRRWNDHATPVNWRLQTVPLLESGCHEGNDATIDTLSAVRNLEKAAAEAAKAKKGK